jgi:hypothetical protein
MVLDEGVGLASAVGLALLGPLPLLGLHGDERVGADAVAAAQLADADLAGNVLALELGEVVALVDDDLLQAVPASASRVTVCSNGSRRCKWMDAREARRLPRLLSGSMHAHLALAEGGAQPTTMSMVPMGMYWVAASSVGWSWLFHAQALVGSWTGRGLVTGRG